MIRDLEEANDNIRVFNFARMQIHDHLNEGQLAIIDQIICSKANYFLGTRESTFTFRIQEERELLGFDSGSSFDRFCDKLDFDEHIFSNCKMTKRLLKRK